MLISFQKLAIAASVVSALIGGSAARAVTYDVSGIDASGDTLTGTIVGDATLSTITSVNLVETLVNSQSSSSFTVVQSYGNSILSATTASNTPVVTIGFSSAVFNVFSTFDPSICSGDPACQAVFANEQNIALSSLGVSFSSQFAATATAEVSTTPLPAALPLFASGLAAAGLIGWRRKRKAATPAT